MQVVAGAIGFLIPKLFQLLKEFQLQKGVKKDVDFLTRELTSMHAALRKVADVPRDQLDEQVRVWADEYKNNTSYSLASCAVRGCLWLEQLPYEDTMEDVVDDFLASDELGSDPNSNKLKQLVEKMRNLLIKGKTGHQIAKKIKAMKILVKVVADRRDRYNVNGVVGNPAATTSVDPRLFDLFKDQKELVGIDMASEEITKKLADGDGDVPKKQLKILSIFGFGGLGKTTLAKVVHERLRDKFLLKAFISIGQKPNVKKVLGDIFLELDKERYQISNASTLDEKQLIEQLRELLENKRYFIVIDDIWDVQAWKIIRCVLKDDNCGSRIITTTRIIEVAKNCGEVYQLKPLSDDNSEKLFHTRLYGGKSKCLFDQPVWVSKKILQKCGGVPLAILTIASLLEGKPREEWPKVYDSIGSGHGENQDDYIIWKETLIWKWVAEGFIMEEPEIGQFEIGERYFNELLNRSMVQPIEAHDNIGVVVGCRVHDLVLDISYVCYLNDLYISSQNNSRRLAIQKIVIEHDNSLAIVCTPQLRSFNAMSCDIRMMPSLSSFRALRVLDMEHCTFMSDGNYHLDYLGCLLQLRYLGLRNMPVDKLPEDIGNLKFLQILDLEGTSIKQLPQSIGKLKQLKCLNADFAKGVGGFHLLGNLTSLEELSLGYANGSPEIVVELGKLTELRKLYMVISYNTHFDDSMVRALVKSLGKLQKIQVLDLLADSVRFGSEDWEGYVPPRQLRELRLTTEYDMLPVWINPSLLPNVTKLSVAVGDVKTHDMKILGSLPELVSLALETLQDFLPDVMAGDSDGGGLFPKLRYFSTDAPLRFLQGAMSIEP
ncbi:hypothetical protein VPH35_042820 [Triticum aestivum]